MKKLSRSPERNTFQKNNYIQRRIEDHKTLHDPNVQAMLEYYAKIEEDSIRNESDPVWAEYNLEYDLRSTDWILEKVRANDVYAQNLYAALCNNDFQKLDTYPILANKTWGCSWRYAGGIVADMRQSGDYIDWYCSGIKNGDHSDGCMPEGVVTDELIEDLQRLGWRVVETNE